MFDFWLYVSERCFHNHYSNSVKIGRTSFSCTETLEASLRICQYEIKTGMVIWFLQKLELELSFLHYNSYGIPPRSYCPLLH